MASMIDIAPKAEKSTDLEKNDKNNDDVLENQNEESSES
jgi:hypothetical protein